MGTELLVLAKVQHILPEIVTISPIQTFSMQECAKPFDNTCQFLEDFLDNVTFENKITGAGSLGA